MIVKVYLKIIFFLIYFVSAGSQRSASLLRTPIQAGDIHSLQLFIDDNPNFISSPLKKKHRNEALLLAIEQRQVEMVDLLLNHANVDASSKGNEAIRQASAIGETEIVRKLLSRPEVNPGAKNNEALMRATKGGYTDIVRLLLAHPKVDPAARHNQALYIASEKNYPDIIKLLITDGHLEPLLFHLERAAHFGNVDLVRFLLSRPSFQSTRDHLKLMILNSVFYGDLQAVKTLVEGGLEMNQDVLQSSIEIARIMVSLENGEIRYHESIMEYLESLQKTPDLPPKASIVMTKECSICLGNENIVEGYMTDCEHQFHTDCLKKWIAVQTTCPICRSAIL